MVTNYNIVFTFGSEKKKARIIFMKNTWKAMTFISSVLYAHSSNLEEIHINLYTSIGNILDMLTITIINENIFKRTINIEWFYFSYFYLHFQQNFFCDFSNELANSVH